MTCLFVSQCEILPLFYPRDFLRWFQAPGFRQSEERSFCPPEAKTTKLSGEYHKERANGWCKPGLLNRGGAPPGGREEISRGREPLHALQRGKFFNGDVYLPNVTPVRILRHYILFDLIPEEMVVGVKFLEVLRAEFEPASQECN